MKSLQDSCIAVIILHGKPYQHLPSKIQEKVDDVEKQMIEMFGGTYYYTDHNLYEGMYLRLNVSLKLGGVWTFDVTEEKENFRSHLGTQDLQFPQFKVKPNGMSKLGVVGGLVFQPGREVTITGLSKFDLENRKFTFDGFCSWHPNNQGTHDIIIEMTFGSDDALHVETTRIDANGIQIKYDDSLPMEDHPIFWRFYHRSHYMAFMMEQTFENSEDDSDDDDGESEEEESDDDNDEMWEDIESDDDEQVFF